MPIDDLWFSKTKKDADGKPLKLKRHGRGMRWRVRWIDPNTGEAKVELFAKKPDAELRDATLRSDIARGQYVDLTAGKIPVRDHAEQWRTSQIHRDATAERIESEFRNHVYPLLGDLQMVQVRPAHIQKWVKTKLDELAPSSLVQVFIDMKAMFQSAVGNCIAKNPCQAANLPEIDAKDRYIPSAEKIHALSAALNPRFAAIPLLTAGTGLRPSEVRALEVEHIDFLRRTIRVEQQVIWSKANGVHVARVKTKTSRRTVEVPQIALDAVAAHLSRFPPVPVVMTDARDPRKPERRPVELVFTAESGKPLHNGGYWHRWWSRAVSEAGLPEGFGLHGLRHYFATALIHAGRSVKVVQLALGHSNPTITLNTYVHEWPGQDERTRDVLESALTVKPVARIDKVEDGH